MNAHAQKLGARKEMVLADARAIVPNLQAKEDQPEHFKLILQKIADWMIRYTPQVSVLSEDCILLDATGCAHLWGGEKSYITAIKERLRSFGYTAKMSMASTIGAAWALTHYGEEDQIVAPGEELQAILSLPPEALRLEPEVIERLYKLGFKRINDFVKIPSAALKRRLGESFVKRYYQAIQKMDEPFATIVPSVSYVERLPALEPITHRNGVEKALEGLLDQLLPKLENEGLGIRKIRLTLHRIDGTHQYSDCSSSLPTQNKTSLLKLFELKFSDLLLEPGVEVFLLEAIHTEKMIATQEAMWEQKKHLADPSVAYLIDKMQHKLGNNAVNRYLPYAQHFPERSIQPQKDLGAITDLKWESNMIRPIMMLEDPDPISVMAPVPDYPPILFRHKKEVHKIIKADGPERIEAPWWIETGLHRDYYKVEDDKGRRYWIYRLGHYEETGNPKWFLHGYFA